MIISASYKTDIPTFYGVWFMKRVEAGYCKMVNPYNKHIYRVSLTKNDVDAFVFWTKNVDPFMKYLPRIQTMGYPFVIQHTINGYPRTLEQSVVNAQKSVENLQNIASEYGKDVAVWRYDTIIISSITPISFHIENFEKLAKDLKGSTDEVVISFAQFYRKTLRNMKIAAQSEGFTWEDLGSEEKQKLASRLAEIARKYDIQVTICSQPEYLVTGTKEAHCIDVDRLSRVAGGKILARLKGNRKTCGCYYSRDIGEYDTCPHGCVYCYAVQNRKLAQERFKKHNPESEFLFEPPSKAIELSPASSSDSCKQLPLFPDN